MAADNDMPIDEKEAIGRKAMKDLEAFVKKRCLVAYMKGKQPKLVMSIVNGEMTVRIEEEEKK